MNDPLLIIIALVFGFFAGILSGLLGIGGGIIFMPVLYYLLPFYGTPNHLIAVTAVATSLFTGSFAAGSSAFNHHQSKNIDYKKAFLVGGGCVTSAIIIPNFAVSLDPKVLSYLLILVLTIVFVRFIFTSNLEMNQRKNLSNKYFLPVGLVVGAISSLCGIGGGVMIIPFLVNFTTIKMKQVIGTSSIITAVTMLSSVIIYSIIDVSSIGFSESQSIVNFAIGIPLGIGAMAGARIGVKGVNKYSDNLLKKIFSLFLLIVIISLLLKI